MIFVDIGLYIIAFVTIWFGSGLIIASTSRFSEKLKLSSFVVSFFVLGLLTSTPEFSVGLQAVANNNPGIFIGNLLGGIVVIFLFIIPVLAIFGRGISLKHELGNKTLLATLGVILAPSIFVLDKRLTSLEGGILVSIYLGLLFVVQKQHGLFDKKNEQLFNKKAYSYKDILKLILGIGLVFISSNIIVDKTILFANLFSIPAFYISLIVIALGTDLPEISLAIRSVITGKKEIAMGDYLGAAAASTFLFGIFTLLYGGEVLTASNFLVTLIFIVTAVGLFYFFSRTQKYISRKNGFILLGIYILFVLFELTR